MDYYVTIPLITGGHFSGKKSECLKFLDKHLNLVKDEETLSIHFHWSESQDRYVDIDTMHPNYVCNVLLKELRTMPAKQGHSFTEYLLDNSGHPLDKVAQLVRTWYTMWGLDELWGPDTATLLTRLEDSVNDENDIKKELVLL